jgi:O-antigen/teichoic acid export membrane protein
VNGITRRPEGAPAALRKGSRFSRLLESPIVADGAVVLYAGSLAMSGSGIVLHVVMSRVLGPSTYGALNSLLGLVLILQVPIGSLEVSVTRRVASLTPDARATVALKPMLTRSVAWALASLGTFVAASPLIASFLHLKSPLPVIAIGLVLVPSIVGVIPKSYLMANKRFRVVGLALGVSSMGRIVIGPVLAVAGLGLYAALFAILLAEAAACLVLAWPLREQLGRSIGRVLRLRFTDLGVSSLAFGGFWLLLTMDVLIARHVLSPSSAGTYAAAATAARAVIFLPGMVANAMFPRFADRAASRADRRRALRHAVVVSTIIAGTAGLVLVLVPPSVVTTVLGTGYRDSAGVLAALAMGAVAMAVTNMLVFYLLSTLSGLSLVSWLAVPVLYVTASQQTSAAGIAQSVLAVDLLVLAVVAMASLREKHVQAEDPSPHLIDLTSEVDVTVVVPFFNPGPRFEKNIRSLGNVLSGQGVSFEIIAVSDGSTDGSERVARDIGAPVRCITLPCNQGKGSALRTGLRQARGEYVGFIDADGDIDPVILRPLITVTTAYRPDIVYASKRHPMSQVTYPPLRRLYSAGFQLLVRLLFRINVRDTQTGLKLVRREVLAAALPRMLEKRFAFDVELFVVAHRLGHRRFFEAPVEIGQRFSSSIDVRAVGRTLQDTLAIFYRLRVLRWYDEEQTASPPVLARCAEDAVV